MYGVEIFYGSMASSAGALLKSLQMIKLADLDQMKADINEFINKPDVEVISVNTQFNDGIMSVLVYYRKK